MGFERRLYEAVCEALPTTTTRTFSADCGMSENYFCSIQGQNLKISVPAMLHLAEVLEQRQALGQTNKPINGIVQMLAEEIALRQNAVNSSSFNVQKIIAKSIARLAYERDNTYNLPPVSMGWQ
jgi:hypothetical protein